MPTSSHPCRPAWAASLLLLVVFNAAVGQVPPPGNPYLYVGAGPACDFADVQAAVDAAAIINGPDVIAIANDQSYSAQQIVIEDVHGLTLWGGWSGCRDSPTSAYTSLSGAGGLAAPVIQHRGAGDILLRNLGMRDGSSLSGGGGLYAIGAGNVTLANVLFVANRGASGGGMSAVGHPSSVKQIRLMGDVEFRGNSADAGGGLYVRHAEIRPIDQPRLLVMENVATEGNGGGWALDNASLLEGVDGGGFGCTMVFSGNRASFAGGGIYLMAAGGQAHFLPRVPRDCALIIQDNDAGTRGGGIEVRSVGVVGAPSLAGASLFATQLNANRAPDGAAAMVHAAATISQSATAFLALVPEIRDGLGASRCVDPCPAMSFNRTETLAGLATNGAILRALTSGLDTNVFVNLGHATVHQNQGSDIFHLSGAGVDLEVLDSLIANSRPLHRVLNAENDAVASLSRSTLVVPNFASAPDEAVLLGDHSLLLEGSILEFHGRDYLRMRRAQNIAVARDLLILDQSLPLAAYHPPATATNILTAPSFGFINAHAGNFRLRHGSPAIDRYRPPNLDNDDLPDMDFNARGYDDPTISNAQGKVYDLGAYERRDAIFIDSFE